MGQLTLNSVSAAPCSSASLSSRRWLMLAPTGKCVVVPVWLMGIVPHVHQRLQARDDRLRVPVLPCFRGALKCGWGLAGNQLVRPRSPWTTTTPPKGRDPD